MRRPAHALVPYAGAEANDRPDGWKARSVWKGEEEARWARVGVRGRIVACEGVLRRGIYMCVGRIPYCVCVCSPKYSCLIVRLRDCVKLVIFRLLSYFSIFVFNPISPISLALSSLFKTFLPIPLNLQEKRKNKGTEEEFRRKRREEHNGLKV